MSTVENTPDVAKAGGSQVFSSSSQENAMRPVGVVLIALYHLVAGLFLVALGLATLLGRSFFGSGTGGVDRSSFGGMQLGAVIGILGAALFFLMGLVALSAAYGMWKMRDWGRVLSLGLAILYVLFTLPAILLLHALLGAYQIVRITVCIAIIGYLLQPRIKALFRQNTPSIIPKAR
jgi:hypothetical protein